MRHHIKRLFECFHAKSFTLNHLALVSAWTVMKKTLLAAEGGWNRSCIMDVSLVWSNQALSPDNSCEIAFYRYYRQMMRAHCDIFAPCICEYICAHSITSSFTHPEHAEQTNRPVSNSMDGFVSAHQITNIKAPAADTCSGKTTKRSMDAICCHRCDC